MTHVFNFIDSLGLIVPMINFCMVAFLFNYLLTFFGG